MAYIDITDCDDQVQMGGCGQVIFTGAGGALTGDIHPTEEYALVHVRLPRSGEPQINAGAGFYLIRVPLNGTENVDLYAQADGTGCKSPPHADGHCCRPGTSGGGRRCLYPVVAGPYGRFNNGAFQDFEISPGGDYAIVAASGVILKVDLTRVNECGKQWDVEKCGGTWWPDFSANNAPCKFNTMWTQEQVSACLDIGRFEANIQEVIGGGGNYRAGMGGTFLEWENNPFKDKRIDAYINRDQLAGPNPNNHFYASQDIVASQDCEEQLPERDGAVPSLLCYSGRYYTTDDKCVPQCGKACADIKACGSGCGPGGNPRNLFVGGHNDMRAVRFIDTDTFVIASRNGRVYRASATDDAADAYGQKAFCIDQLFPPSFYGTPHGVAIKAIAVAPDGSYMLALSDQKLHHVVLPFLEGVHKSDNEKDCNGHLTVPKGRDPKDCATLLATEGKGDKKEGGLDFIVKGAKTQTWGSLYGSEFVWDMYGSTISHHNGIAMAPDGYALMAYPADDKCALTLVRKAPHARSCDLPFDDMLHKCVDGYWYSRGADGYQDPLRADPDMDETACENVAETPMLISSEDYKTMTPTKYTFSVEDDATQVSGCHVSLTGTDQRPIGVYYNKNSGGGDCNKNNRCVMRADKLCYDSNGSFNTGTGIEQWDPITKLGRQINPYTVPNSGYQEVLNAFRNDEYAICDRIVAEHDDIRYCPPVRHGGPGQSPLSDASSWVNRQATCNVEKICVSSYPKAGTLLKVTIEK